LVEFFLQKKHKSYSNYCNKSIKSMSSTPIKRGRRQQKISSSDSVSKWEKALTKNAKWSKEELYTVLSLFRQILSLCCGIIWGIGPIKGYVGLVR